MIAGKPTVFLSCSEKYKKSVAMSLQGMLKDRGIHAVIVSQVPHPRGIEWDPDAKVQWYLEGSEALIALCTPDDTLDNGTVTCRQNIIDEIRHARELRHLRNKIMVLKAAQVQLPSNINPTYEALDPHDVGIVLPVVLAQLTEWGVLQQKAAEPASVALEHQEITMDLLNRTLLAGIGLGDHTTARARAYNFMCRSRKAMQRDVVQSLGNCVTSRPDDDDDSNGLWIAASMLEAINVLDGKLVPYELIEEMTLSPVFSVRSCAAVLLWDKAKTFPGEVPLDLIGRLARPDEDWYVWAPAIAATKLLILSRDDAYVILEHLASSDEPADRAAAIKAILDIAEWEPVAVKRSLVEQLVMDEDKDIATVAVQVLGLIHDVGEQAYIRRFRPFGL